MESTKTNELSFKPKYDGLFQGGPDCYICRKNDGHEQACTIANVESEDAAELVRKEYWKHRAIINVRAIPGNYKRETDSIFDQIKLSQEPTKYEIDTGACKKHRLNLLSLLEKTLETGTIDAAVIRESKNLNAVR